PRVRKLRHRETEPKPAAQALLQSCLERFRDLPHPFPRSHHRPSRAILRLGTPPSREKLRQKPVSPLDLERRERRADEHLARLGPVNAANEWREKILEPGAPQVPLGPPLERQLVRLISPV